MNRTAVLAVLAAVVLVVVYLASNTTPPADSRPVSPLRPVTPPARNTLYVFVQPGCAPCRSLEATLKQRAVVAALRPYDVQVVDLAKDGDERFQQYHVTATPTLVIADAGGTELDHLEGAAPAGDLVQWLAKKR